MSEKKFTIKRKTSSGYDTFYPKTTVEQVDGLSTELNDKQDKIVIAISQPASLNNSAFWYQALPYNIKCNLSHIVGASGNPTKVAVNGSATLTFTSTTGYSLPYSISVTGANYTYNRATSSVVVSNPTSDVTITINALPSFANSTWTEIAAICDAGKAATYVADGVWTVGEINTSINYLTDTGGIQLVHVLTDEQRGSSYYNTSGHIIVQFVNAIASAAYMGSQTAQVYFSSVLNATCNTTIYNNLNDALKPLLKSWNCIVGCENTGSGTVSGLYNQSVYLAAPTAKEVGSTNTYNASEDAATFTFDYYSTDPTARRIKSGAQWWTRSPSFYNGSGSVYYASFKVNSDGGLLYYGDVRYASGVSPIGCI